MLPLAEAVCIPPDRVQFVWHKVSHWIKAALRRGDLGTFEQVQSDVVNGQALLWLAWNDPDIEGAAVTQLVRSENGLVCLIVACGGLGVSRWLHLIGKLEDYARAEGCDRVRILGRKGWARVLPRYQTTKIVLERRL